jgi:Glycosyltransferase
MRVGILTMFNGLATIYSLVNVVAEHLRMLLDAGEDVSLFVCEDLPEKEKSGIYLDPRIKWVKVCNRYQGEQIHWRDYSSPDTPIHAEFMEEAITIGKDLTEKMKDLDVCIMHDIHYQGWHLVHNVAVRYAAERLPHLRFVAVTHSLPDESQLDKQIPWPHSARYSPMNNTIYTFPTECGLPSLARQFRVGIDQCCVLNNTLDLIGHMSAQVLDLHMKIDLLSPDILIVYPARFTKAKKFEKVAMLAGAIHTVSGLRVKVIFCEFPALDTNSVHYKAEIWKEGTNYGINPEDIIFVSDYGYPMGLGRESILNLFSLSNLFICPSYSESFGLTALEAAAMGNFLVLNEAVPALQEVGEMLEAYFLRWDACNFGYNTMETYYPSEKEYYEEHAAIIIEEMKSNKVIQAKRKVRQRYNPKWVYENQLSKLLK